MGNIVGLIGVVLYLALMIAIIAGVWKTFAKAGQPGWACIVPIYNLIVMLKIAGRPIWWIIPVVLVPFFGLIPCIDIAKKFGKGTGFGIGLGFLGFIFFPMLGFGDSQYQG